MKQEKQQEIALMRYGAIAPIIAGLDERYPSKTAFYTEISAKGLMGPDGKLHHYAPATIEKSDTDVNKFNVVSTFSCPRRSAISNGATPISTSILA